MSKLKQHTDLEHMRRQTDMYLGTKDVITSKEYVLVDNQISLQPVRISPAFLKIYDEILVNAIDQYTLAGSDINIHVDSDLNIIIQNSPGYIRIEYPKTTDGRIIISVQFVFGEFKTSSNFDDENNPKPRITGGMFGIGSKGVNAFSKFFQAMTYDPNFGKLVVVTWQDCMSKEPVVEIEPTDDKTPFTQIHYLANLEDFPQVQNNKEDFFRMAYMRALQTAVFCRYSKVKYNGNIIKVSAKEYFQMHNIDKIVECEIAPPNKLHIDAKYGADLSWRVLMGVKNNGDMQTFSIINGMFIKSGTHIDHVVNQIMEYIKPKWLDLRDPSRKRKKEESPEKLTEKIEQLKSFIKEENDRDVIKRWNADIKKLQNELRSIKEKQKAMPKFDQRSVQKYLMLMIVGHINRPNVSGQRKDQITSTQSVFNDYILPQNKLEELWQNVKPYIEYDLFVKSTDTVAKNVKCIHHHRSAIYGTARSHEGTLVIAEGDSAEGTIRSGLNTPGSQLNADTFGTFIIGGVPMNARKKIKYVKNPKTGELTIVKDKELIDNERLAELEQVLGIRQNCRYKTLEEIRTLKYGRIVIATDQDQDGIGNIRSQIVNYFWTLYPGIIKHGVLCAYNSPLIRAVPRTGRVIEFYTEREFREWKPDGNYKITYYKGLGGHGKEEREHMFRHFEEHVVTYVADDKTETLCEIYFGKNADYRKIALSTCAQNVEEDYYYQNKVNIRDHLNTSTKTYQLYNIARHVKSFIDGGLPSSRKIWAGVRELPNERQKVFELGGAITKSMKYHHGDGSMNQCIIGQSQDFPGAHEFPILLPMSNSGSRNKGGDDAASARYNYVKYNKPLGSALFPDIDDYILNYVFDDGQRVEPVFYVPVVPLSILENYRSPATGWASKLFARDYWQVSQHLHLCIDNRSYVERQTDFEFTKHRFRHVIRKINGEDWSFGTFVRDNNTLRITELPVGVWTDNWCLAVSNHPQIAIEPINRSTDTRILIDIKFNPGYLSTRTDDELINELGLKESLKSNINLIGADGGVCCFDKYTDVFRKWFDVRLEYYKIRITRTSAILRMRIRKNAECIKFIKNKVNIANRTRDEQIAELRRLGYIELDKKYIDRPSFDDAKILEDLAFKGPNISYDYLRNMTADDCTVENMNRLIERNNADQTELDRLGEPDAEFRMWKQELTNLDNLVREAQNSNRFWNCFEPQMRFE